MSVVLAAAEAAIITAAAVCVFWAATAAPDLWEMARLVAMCIAIKAATDVVVALEKRRNRGRNHG